jgi:hypothetical protein
MHRFMPRGLAWRLACALALFAAVLSAATVLQAAAAARTVVSVPQAAKEAGVVMLDVAIRPPRGPGTAQLGAVVRLSRSGGGPSVEVGRVSLLPGASDEQSFQFNVADAVRRLNLAGGYAEVEVAVVDRAGGAAPAATAVTIGAARIVTR